jgi:prepilin signal peptidase PulO-like enzyme (type II secretory pathway)
MYLPIFKLGQVLERQCDEPAFNLMVPRSSCRQCGHQIRWHENIPVLSYLLLRGKCSACHAHWSALPGWWSCVTGLLFAWCAVALGLDADGCGLVRLFCGDSGAGTDRLGHHPAAGRHHAAPAVGWT